LADFTRVAHVFVLVGDCRIPRYELLLKVRTDLRVSFPGRLLLTVFLSGFAGPFKDNMEKSSRL
jgi:hypothetical protein